MVDQNFTIQCSIVLHNNMADLWNNNQEIMVPIFVTMEMVSIAIWVIPYQINQKKSQPLHIFMKFGIDMDSTKKLSHTKIWPILLISL